MEETKYKTLLNNKSVIHYGDNTTNFFTNKEMNVVVEFGFYYNGIPPAFSHKKRIDLNVFPFINWTKEMPPIVVNNDFIILVNSGAPNYAMTFNLCIDAEQNTVEVKLGERPSWGESLLTQEEIDGIKIIYNQNHNNNQQPNIQ